MEERVGRTAPDKLRKVGVILLFLFGCAEDDKPKFACGNEISLQNDVMPIISSSCNLTLCHAEGTNPILLTRESVIQNAQKILDQVSTYQMPPPSELPLTQEESDLIRCWVEDGAKDG